MQILIASSEAVPYIKTGGLGDVAGNLTLQFAKHRHQVCLVLPLYQEIDREAFGLKKIDKTMNVVMGDCTISCQVWKQKPTQNVTVYFIDQSGFFDRTPIYDHEGTPYYDNGARFSFFSKAVLDLAIFLNFKPDILLCNDWQTAIVPYYLKAWGWEGDFFNEMRRDIY